MPAPENYVGKDGTVTVDGWEPADVLAWSLKKTVDVTVKSTSSSGGRKRRYAGAKDCTGTFKLVLNGDDPLIDHLDVGDNVQLHLEHASGKYYNIYAMITSSDTASAPENSSDPVEITCEFGGQYNDSGTSFADPTF